MKKFGLFSAGSTKGQPFLNYEVLWTPIIKGRLKSHSWLDNTGWEEFLDKAEVGEVYNGKDIIIVVRLLEEEADFTEPDSNDTEK
ncbi:MAG TPA: hypothetical protein VN688_33335 [Gemmataceae bacterium]|nr:hypothetical protein [Gemmataceae bacterium]